MTPDHPAGLMEAVAFLAGEPHARPAARNALKPTAMHLREETVCIYTELVTARSRVVPA